MSGLDQLIGDMQAQQYAEQSTSLGDIYHEVRVALYKHTTGELTTEAYNAKVEEMQKFLESMKFYLIQTIMNELPKYQSHKTVRALQIESLEPAGANYFIHPVNKGFSAFPVPTHVIDKHKPEIGWYWVRYEDGYESFSPASAFESGYTLISN